MLPISFADLITFRTPAELMAHFKDEEINLNIDFNKVDLNLGYIMTELAKGIDKRDWNLITGLDSDTVANLISLKQFYDGFTVSEFVKMFYGTKFDDYFLAGYIKDYIKMCLETGHKFRIGFSSENELRTAHDDLADEIRKKVDENELRLPLVPERSKFDILEERITEWGKGEFERIRSTPQLLNEGETQHNCVFSRRHLIRKDHVAIFHWKHNGRNYTVQFNTNRKGNFFVKEVRARFNETITAEDLADLKRMLSGFCTVSNDIAGDLRLYHAEMDIPNWRLLGDDEDLPF